VTARLSELTRSRAFHGLSNEDCGIWFGVGIQTLERIEAGEVVPSEELEARIDRFLKTVGSGGFGGFPAVPPTPDGLGIHSRPTGGAARTGRSANFGAKA
jgi:DNA-binding XRE family transcriptional regulator